MKTLKLLFVLIVTGFLSCSAVDDSIDGGPFDLVDTTDNTDDDSNENTNDNSTYNSRRILSLGDSYTIGQSVCETCRFPIQLKDSIQNTSSYNVEVDIVAQTGWTTFDLIEAIDNEELDSEYDLVTLLIGVNNQYQNVPFSVYQSEFPELIETAISKANGMKDKVIVISIPDYAYTVFGQNTGNPEVTTQEIDLYNDYAESYCNAQEITYVYITDITRLGLEQPQLVASDGLHPSTLAYSKFVERLLPFALEKIE